MRLTIQRADLARVLTNVGRVVEPRNTIPILGNVKLSAVPGQLTVTGTDLDIEAVDTAPADVETPGTVCVDAKLLSDIAKKAGGDITISEEGGQLVVKSGRSRTVLGTLPAADFPSLDGAKYTAEFDIDLAALFAPVAFAIAVNDSRHMLEGIYLVSDGDSTTAVATNGHRLSRHVISSAPAFSGIIVPAKAVGLIPKGVIKVSVSDSLVRFASDDFVIVSKLIDLVYPEYERVIPQGNGLIAGVKRSELLAAVDRVTVVAKERGKAVRLSVSPGSIQLSIRTNDGESEDEIAAEYSGEPTEIGFNSVYLRECMSVFPEGVVTIALRDPASPAVLTSEAAPGLDLTLMPVRI